MNKMPGTVSASKPARRLPNNKPCGPGCRWPRRKRCWRKILLFALPDGCPPRSPRSGSAAGIGRVVRAVQSHRRARSSRRTGRAAAGRQRVGPSVRRRSGVGANGRHRLPAARFDGPRGDRRYGQCRVGIRPLERDAGRTK